MSDESPVSLDRRGVLALAGSAAFAGCGRLERMALGERDVTLDGAEIRTLGVSEPPTVPETIPAEIEQAYLDRTETRARTLLSSVPAPLGPDEIPNGAIREDLLRRREHAEEAIVRADTAASPVEALRDLRRARAKARALAAGWRAVDDGLTREAVSEEAPELRDGLDAFRDRWEYVGADRVQAVLVHEPIEALIRRADTSATIDTSDLKRGQENPVSVGDLAAQLEGARALLDDAEYLYDQFRASLDGPQDLRSTLETAADDLVATVERRRNALPADDAITPSPDGDRDVEGTPAARALEDLYDGAVNGRWIEENHSAGRVATVILAAHETLAEIRAFETLRDRVAGGETFTVTRTADVRAIRSEAVSAIETAMAETRHPDLTREVIADLAPNVRHADQELRDVQDEVDPEWLTHELSIYVTVAATARAAPAASERAVAALRSS